MPDEIVEQSEESEGKLDRFKAHIKRHQVAYAFGTGIVVTTAVFIATKRIWMPYLLRTPYSIDMFWKPTGNLIEVSVPELNRGNHIVNTGNRVGFFSQQAVARAYDTPPSEISKHLHGEIPNIKGEVFERVTFRVFAEPY